MKSAASAGDRPAADQENPRSEATRTRASERLRDWRCCRPTGAGEYTVGVMFTCAQGLNFVSGGPFSTQKTSSSGMGADR